MVCWQFCFFSCFVVVFVICVCFSRGLCEWVWCGRLFVWGGVCVCVCMFVIKVVGLRGCSLLVFIGGGFVGIYGRESGLYVVRFFLCFGDLRRLCSIVQKFLFMGFGFLDIDFIGCFGFQWIQVGVFYYLMVSRIQVVCFGVIFY